MWLEYLLHHCMQTTRPLFAPTTQHSREDLWYRTLLLRNLCHDRHLLENPTILGLVIKLTHAHVHFLGVH